MAINNESNVVEPAATTTGGKSGASVANATANIIKSGVGTGLLFMPYVFLESGIILSIAFMAMMGFFGFYSWSQLCQVIRILESRGLTYNGQKSLTLDTACGIVLGEKFKKFSIACTLVFIYGSSLGYMIFILQTMEDYFSNSLITIGIVFGIYMPLSMFKQIEKLGIFSHFGIFALSTAICVVLGLSASKIGGSSTTFSNANLCSITSLPLYFGVFAFAYDINGVVTEVHASMREKSKFSFVLGCYILFSFILGSVLGVLGYLAYSDNVNSVIFKNINDEGGFISPAVSSLYSFSLVASILLYGFPIVKEADKLLNVARSPAKIPIMMASRVAFFASICFLGYFVQSITNVFNLLGCVFSVLLTFIIPVILSEKLKKIDKQGIKLTSVVINNEQHDTEVTPFIPKEILNSSQPDNLIEEPPLPTTKLHSIFNYVIVVIGVIGGISGLISSIIDLFE